MHAAGDSLKAVCEQNDAELLALMPKLVLAERASAADVLSHLVEIDRRKLFVEQACGSLTAYCIERLGYSEDEACMRVRVARVAGRFPSLLGELRSGAIHLTGLFLLSNYLTDPNHAELVAAARNKSKREIEQLIAARFPKPDIADLIAPVPEQTELAAAALTCSGTDPAAASAGKAEAQAAPVATGHVKPLSPARISVQFSARRELRDKIGRAQELMSHSVPSGDLGTLFERALDALIERETKRKFGVGKPRKRRPLEPGSRHIPVEIARRVCDGRAKELVKERAAFLISVGVVRAKQHLKIALGLRQGTPLRMPRQPRHWRCSGVPVFPRETPVFAPLPHGRQRA
jgi:hypothetical protein